MLTVEIYQQCERFDWLPGLGSNQGLQLQRLTCYRYTTGQGELGAGAKQ